MTVKDQTWKLRAPRAAAAFDAAAADRALARRTRVPIAKQRQQLALRRAQLKIAVAASRYQRDAEFRWRHSSPIAVIGDNP